MTEIRIYFEGDKSLRPGFRAFFRELEDRARAARCKFNLVSSGGTAKRDFGIAIRSHANAWNILLIDSEGPDNGELTASLIAEQRWSKEHKDSIFWMVEMMESWFHADKEAVQRFYKDGFNIQAMKANPNVEQISKKDLVDGLKAATRNSPKGRYHKTRHAPALLELIDPNRVRQAAPNCDRLFTTVLGTLSGK
jgi:Domain of unknown function (DUF4276)